MTVARLLILVPLMTTLACAGGQVNRSGTPRADPNVISSAEMTSTTQLNLYSFISASRPRWLESRRTTTFDGRTSTITVFLDGQRFGTVDQLRNMSLTGVKEIRYYGVAEAQQRFNLRDLGSVINVVMQ